jgi:hypothetical protein
MELELRDGELVEVSSEPRVDPEASKRKNDQELLHTANLIKRFIERYRDILGPDITVQWAFEKITKGSKMGVKTLKNKLRKADNLAYKSVGREMLDDKDSILNDPNYNFSGGTPDPVKWLELVGDPVWENNKLIVRYSVPEYPGEIITKELDLLDIQKDEPIE